MSGFMSVGQVYGINAQTPSYGVAAPTQRMGVTDIPDGWKGLVHPNNPLVVFGAFLAVTFGLAAVSGVVRVGKAKVSASVGTA